MTQPGGHPGSATTSPVDAAVSVIAPHPRAKGVLASAAVGLTLVVLATLVAVVVVNRGTIVGSHPNAPAPVLLNAANAVAPDPFTASVARGLAPISPEAVQQIQTLIGQLAASGDRGVRLVSGSRPGLYAGVGQDNSCDTAALANDLDASPSRARSWAQVMALQPAQVPFYLNTLTPVTMTTDTWVTAHGFATDGATTTYQSVLQAGSAVMIDQAGVPRVQCISGNPLQPPASVDLRTLKAAGASWPGYDLQNVVAVSCTNAPSSFSDPVPTTPITDFSLLDLRTGQPFSRHAGGTIDLGRDATAALPDPISANVPPAQGGH